MRGERPGVALHRGTLHEYPSGIYVPRVVDNIWGTRSFLSGILGRVTRRDYGRLLCHGCASSGVPGGYSREYTITEKINGVGLLHAGRNYRASGIPACIHIPSDMPRR